MSPPAASETSEERDPILAGGDTMACLNVLKLEIKAIQDAFPKTHDRYAGVAGQH